MAFVLSVPRPAPAPTPPARAIIKHAFVTAASVDLRDGPGPEFKALARIFKGMPVDVLEVLLIAILTGFANRFASIRRRLADRSAAAGL